MPEDAVQQVLAVNSYKGDSTAGGMQNFGVKLDATPFDKLAQYTYLAQQQQWERKNTQIDDAAKTMAGAMAIDINSPFPEYYSFLQTKQKELQDLMKDTSVLTFQDNPEGNKLFNQKFSELKNLKNKAVADGLKLNAELSEIEKLNTPEEREVALRLLEENKKDLLKDGAEKALTQKPILKTGTRYSQQAFELPKIGTVEYATVQEFGNSSKKTETKVLDLNSAYTQANILELQMGAGEFVPNKEVSESDNNKAKIIFDQNKKNGGLEQRKQVAQKFNSLYKEYTVSKLAYDNLTPEQKKITPEPPKPEVLTAAEEFNIKVDAANKILQAQSQTGNKPPIPEFKKVVLEDGISTAELIYMDMGSKMSSFIKYEETNTGTDNAIQNRNLDIQEKDNNRKNSLNERKFKAEQDKLNSKPLAAAGGTALEGNIIYSVNGYIGGNSKKKIVNGTAVNIVNGQQVFDPTFSKEVELEAGTTGAYIQSWYNKYNTLAGDANSPKVKIEKDKITAIFTNGIITGIRATNGGIITVDEFKKITDINAQNKETKYISETEVGVGGNSNGLP